MSQKDLTAKQDRRLKFARGVQFVIYCWAMRLAFAGVGTVLVSLFQFIVPTDSLGVKLHHLNIVSWTSVVKANYRAVKDSIEPVLYQGVGVISPELLRAKYTNLVPLSSTTLKLSEVRDYMYFDETRLWSGNYTQDRRYAYISASEYLKDQDGNINLDPFLDTFSANANAATERGGKFCMNNAGNQGMCANFPSFVYGTHNNALHALPALSPALAQYVSLESSTPQVCLWMSSANVSAGLHFDLEDNFLLQVSGVKKIVLVSPEAVSALTPHSSWHPHWRQASSARGLYTSNDILSHLRVSLNNTSIPERLQEGQHANQVAASASASGGSHNMTDGAVDRSGFSFGEVKVWEATLHPGDMIFIPAGYYHAVSAATASVSVNAWFYSELSELYSLLENAPLPFQPEESASEQLTKLSITTRRLLFLLGVSPLVFPETMRARYRLLLPISGALPTQSGALLSESCRDADVSTELSAQEPMCNAELVLAADYTQVEDDMAVLLHDAIRSKPRVTQALAVTALLDYLEEVLQSVWGDAGTSPQRALTFVTNCVGVSANAEAR